MRKPFKPNKFAESIECHNMQEVCTKAIKWNFGIPEEQHLIRSSILSVHANLEAMLKHILFHHMVRLINEEQYKSEDETSIRRLLTNIERLSFNAVLQLIQPCLDSFNFELMQSIVEINRLRNEAVHRFIDLASYKGRNPFKDHDALAQVLFEAKEIHAELGEFFIQRIGLPPDGLLREIRVF